MPLSAARLSPSANIATVDASRLDFTLAKASDAQAIFDLVYLHPDPFLRAVKLEDVENWIAHGACWIVRDSTNKIVGACNIRVPETTADSAPEPAEFGGIFLLPNYRERGVADALAVLALASYYWDNDPEDLNPIPVISHVHIKNDKPLKLLDRIGFIFQREISVPDGVPGFEHMPREEDGRLLGKEFLLPAERRIQLFREMAKLISTREIGTYAISVLPALGMIPEELERLATHLEMKRSG